MIIKVKVKPCSKETKIIPKKTGDELFIEAHLKERPEKGKANKELLRELKKLFGDLELVSGHSSREKYIKVNDNIKIEEFIKK